MMDEHAELQSWLRRAFEHTATLPRKSAKKAAPKAKPAKKKKR
jgi:hypothetical protein